MRAVNLWFVLLLLQPWVLLATAHAEEQVTSVLIMPVSCRDADANTCKTLTEALTHEAGRIPGRRVVATAELEQALGGDRMRQLAACDSASCAQEIAGAVNTDELVFGALGHVGSELVMTLSRLGSRDAAIRGRTLRRAPDAHAEMLLDGLPNAVHELFGLPPLPEKAVPNATAQEVPPTPPTPPARVQDDGATHAAPTHASIRQALATMDADEVYRRYAVRLDGTDAYLGGTRFTRHHTVQRMLGMLLMQPEPRTYLESDPAAADELPGAAFQASYRVVWFFMALFLVLGVVFLIALPVGLFLLTVAGVLGVVDIILTQLVLSREEKAAAQFNQDLRQMIDEESRRRTP